MLGAGGKSVDRRSPLPRGHRFGGDPVPSGQHDQAFLTLVDGSTPRRCRAGAPVKDVSHSASFQ